MINAIEEISGMFISAIAGFFNKNNSETDIPSAVVNAPSWVEYTGDPSVTNPEQTLDVETWVANEVTFKSDKTYDDPFNDVDVDLLLFDNGRLYKNPAFRDGSNTWKARFVCPSAGTWYYKTICTDSDNYSLMKEQARLSAPNTAVNTIDTSTDSLQRTLAKSIYI